MYFSKEYFLECVNIINKKNYDYGNDVLYRNCNFNCLPEPGNSQKIDTKLSSMIWLIGKAYSADPTRSAAKDSFSNKGLGSSFESIANIIHDCPLYEKFYNELQSLRGEKYSYQYEKDRPILSKVTKLVNTLNEMIKCAMEQVAKGKKLEKTESKNVISFSSKFLHFMCPHLFYIIDSYSFNGGVALFSGKADKTLYIADDNSKNMCIGREARKYFKEHPSVHSSFANDLLDAVTPYDKHCLRCYHLSCFLHENNKTCKPQINGDPDSSYMPRLVDSIMMRIT